jgi:cytochrome c5
MLQRTLQAALLVAFIIAPASHAEEKPLRPFLHFGNMGGLMPTLEQADLPEPDSVGAKLINHFCSQCHNVPGPGMRTEEEWNRIFWSMIWRMYVMDGRFSEFDAPKYDESKVMFEYVRRNSLVSIKSSDVDLRDEGASEFIATCMQCHQLPDPRLHKGEEWREIVLRMKNHMKSMNRHLPNDLDTGKVIHYLRHHSEK